MHPPGPVGHRPLRLLGTATDGVVRPGARLLLLHVLHDPFQVRSAAGLETQLLAANASDEERQLASLLIDSATTPLDWSRYRDDTQEKLATLVEAKIQNRQVVAPAEEPVQVLQLLDALKQSVLAAAGPAAKAPPKPRRRASTGQRRSA